ncbi:MAG: hypothetical protein E7208_00900 [Clostridium butyricum]|nr:hypothetical protein [Clostridium butyricum]
MKISKNCIKWITLFFILLAALIFAWVLFVNPKLGVADQGDFDRVMNAAGLSLLDSDVNNPNFIRFYEYIVTDYKINSINNIFTTIGGTSMGALITLICYMCTLLGKSVFKTQYLAIAYFLIYLSAFLIILKSINLKNPIKYAILILLTLFIFFDGNYLIWFNSLYGEPMMISTLLLFIGSVLYYTYYKYSLKREDKLFSKLVFIFISALLFIGSKLQVTMCLPFIILLIAKIVWDNKKSFSKANLVVIGILFISLVAYPIAININSGSLSKDTQYNSVFYGVLNGSETPEQDLIDMGLNPDMAVEAGKHSYLPTDEYVKYIPRTEITEEEFYSKMSNGKLAKFYLTHPKRLLDGMQYTANNAFYTSTDLGKTYQGYSEEPITEFSRFTTWSYIRENFLPKQLWFIIAIYLIMFIYSIITYKRNKSNPEMRIKSLLILTLIFISGLQFPMPFVGNGHADTAKQLYLFNFIFDIFFILILMYIIYKLIDYIKNKYIKQ